MTLYFLRHGDAIESTVLHDSERPLSELGQLQGAVAGRFLRSLNASMSLILASPFLRAQQMSAAVNQEIGGVPLSTSEYLTASSDPRQIVARLSQLSAQNVMLVGHEPHLSKTISLLISGSAAQCVEMKKGSLACLELSAQVERAQAVLKWLLTTKQMESALRTANAV
jgi:phosphohistidine phosphatase